MKATDLIAEAISRPEEERARVDASLLTSLSPLNTDIDKKWTSIAKQRLAELQGGDVESVPGDEVFRDIWNRPSG